MQVTELEEIRNETYENAKITKNEVKIFHDKFLGEKVMLYNSRLHHFPRKLKLRWTGPFSVKTVILHGVVEICDPKNDNVFKVNSQRLKPFLTIEPDTCTNTLMGLFDLFYE